ncbi:lipoprotein heptaprenylglyceryl N-acetyltransferase LhaT [Salisediminibacterium selenitireducens]|uniref:DUF1405 domain-containing protein n=1 Tax=Bacillus selenitireducens (strain ATCC 700615 / DSM 15326 / MLS10) TaxID=439292 RepID=D6XUY0_BACIE|nr:DUF1405 domain-containing protein [Salisediminibacterium selenitireducens]ADH99616.1 protein of unknown function DUF1405 [[Bacillus] selenitireducens MLS10]
MFQFFIATIGQRWFLWLLLLINVPGTIYGYIWYEAQLIQTPAIFLPFVPDSPTASLFFVVVLIAFLLGNNIPIIEALAAVTLFKYGIWAVAMILAAGAMGSVITLLDFMLIFSHLGMAVQGLLYMPYYRIKVWHIAAAGIWTLHNDVIDYVYGMHPWVKSSLTPYISEVAYFTFWLSIISLLLVYFMNNRMEKRELHA